MKATLFILLFFVSFSSVAAPLSWRAKQAFRILDGDDALRNTWLSNVASDNVYDQYIQGLHSLVSSDLEQPPQAAELFLLELISAKYGLSIDWKPKDSILDDTRVFISNVVDPDRPFYKKAELVKVKKRYVVQQELESPYSSINGPTLSSTRMRNGLSPAGPDGKLVRLCRLFDHPKASFFEMSYSQSLDFVKIGADMPVDDLCGFYPGLHSRYWPKRLKLFPFF